MKFIKMADGSLVNVNQIVRAIEKYGQVEVQLANFGGILTYPGTISQFSEEVNDS